MAGTYDAAYSEFTNRFNLNGLNLKETYEVNRKLNGLNDFTFDSTPQKKEQSIYLDTLTSALTAYLTEKTKMEYDKAYDMSDVSIVDFVKEFEKVMKAIRTDVAPKNEPYKHTPFAKLSEGVMASRAWKEVKHFNQPLSGIWGDQIRKGTITPENLQSMTNRSISMLDGMVNNNMKYSDEAKKDLANVVMAKNTMAAAINKRSWTSWLNPLNWGPNRRENAYLRELEGKIESYKTAGFPVDTVVPEAYTSNMLGKALGELQKNYGTKNKTQKQTTSEVKVEAKEEIKENVQEEQQNLATSINEEKEQVFHNEEEFVAASQNTVNNAKPVVKPVKEEKTNYAQRANELLGDENFEDELLDEMYDIIKDMESPSLRGGAKRSFLRVSALKTATEKAVKFCDRYDDAKTPEEKEEIVKDYTIGMVGDLTISMNFYKFSSRDNFVAAQKIADLVLNKCTPIAFEGNKYAKYSSNFVAKNDELLNKTIVQQGGDSDREVMEGAREDLGVDKSIEGLTEDEIREKEYEERVRIQIEKEEQLARRVRKIEEETPDLTKLFGDTERDKQEELEKLQKHWRSF